MMTRAEAVELILDMWFCRDSDFSSSNEDQLWSDIAKVQALAALGVKREELSAYYQPLWDKHVNKLDKPIKRKPRSGFTSPSSG